MSTFAGITFLRNVMNHVVILYHLFLLKLPTEVEELGETAIVIAIVQYCNSDIYTKSTKKQHKKNNYLPALLRNSAR